MMRSARLSRRATVRAGAASVAVAAIGGMRLSALAQDATPAAGGAAPEIVLALIAAYEAEDVDAALALFAPDAVFEHEGYGDVVTGHEQLQFLHEAQFEGHEDITFTDVSGFEVDGHVAAEANWTSTNVYDAPGGNPGPDENTFRFALIGDVNEDGQFTRLAMYFDTHRPSVQSGHAEPYGPAGTPPSN